MERELGWLAPVIGIATTEIAGYSAVEYGRNLGDLYGASRSSQLERMDDGYFTPNLPIRVELEIYVDHVECSRSSRWWITPVYRKITLISYPIGPSDLDIRAWQGILAA